MKNDVSKGNASRVPDPIHGETTGSPAAPIKKRSAFLEGIAAIITAIKKKRTIHFRRRRTRKDGTYTETEFRYNADD